jgi:hypothetical protein
VFLSSAVSFACAYAAHAAFVAPTTWARPTSLAQASTALTTFQHFDVFADDDGNPDNGVLDAAPDLIDLNPNGPASVGSTVAFVTGSGNLYNPTAVIDVALTVPSFGLVSAQSTRLLLQIQTQGNPLLVVDPTTGPDFSAFSVNDFPLTDFAPRYVRLASAPGGPLGAIIDHAIEFTVSGNAASYLIVWEPSGTSSSHRQILVDSVVMVPESGIISLLGAGLVVLGRRR